MCGTGCCCGTVIIGVNEGRNVIVGCGKLRRIQIAGGFMWVLDADNGMTFELGQAPYDGAKDGQYVCFHGFFQVISPTPPPVFGVRLEEAVVKACPERKKHHKCRDESSSEEECGCKKHGIKLRVKRC